MNNFSQIESDKCEFLPVAAVEELPIGERLFLDVDNQEVVLFNIKGEIYAILDLCSHDDGPLGDGDLEGCEISCPRHGARFDVRTGKALSLPAVVDIPSFPTRVKDGLVEVGFPPSRS